MKKIIVFLLPVHIYALSLYSLLEHAHSNNKLVLSKELSQKSKLRELDAKESSYYPTIDAGAFYQNLDERTTGLPGDIYSAYAKVGFGIYDGGSKSALVEQKEAELKASTSDVDAIKKDISLGIMKNFFSIKSLEATLASRQEAQKSLQVQLERIQAFYDAALATKDDVDRLQAAYDTNIYEMESVKLNILTLKLNLSLEVGKNVGTLEDSSFKEELEDDFEKVDAIKSLEYSKEALKSLSNSVDSAYYPQLRVEDTYSVYDYSSTDAAHPKGLDNQNKILLSANIRLFDNATISNTKQAIVINSQALAKQIEYKTQEQKMLHELALARIQTSKVKIKSAASALAAATSAYETIEKKYTAGIVDNVVYLDALVAKTNASSLYKTSLNDLQISYGMYYYYKGKKLEEFLNE